MAAKQMHDEESRVLDFDPAYPFKAACEVVTCTPHSFSGNGIDSVALMVRHTWVHRREPVGPIRKGPGRVTPSVLIEGQTFYHTVLVGDQLGPIIGHLDNRGNAMLGKKVMMCGTPFQGTQEINPNSSGEKSARNLIYLRDARVYLVGDEE
jgi:hypothetical protein